jgi:RNA ligase (TIGR02306 family)
MEAAVNFDETPHRALCSVVTVKSMSPIAGADKIVLAEVNGWQCVVAKDEGIKEGDLALYFSIDSIPDLDDPNCALVKKRGGRIKTIKLRGIISQGLLAPLKWLSSRGHNASLLADGDDVTDLMGVTKVNSPLHLHIIYMYAYFDFHHF